MDRASIKEPRAARRVSITHRLRGVIHGQERTFYLTTRESFLGSAATNDVCLPVVGVSRRHAVLRLSAEGLVVEDLGSRNGTFVAQRRIERGEAAPPGTEISFGPAQLTVEAVEPGDAELAVELETGGEEGPAPGAGTAGRREETTELWADVAGAAAPPSRRGRRGAERRREVAPAPALTFPDGFLPGTSAAALALYQQLRQLLRGDRPALLVGETGVGKEQIARTLHLSSARRLGPFVAVNCAAIPAAMLEAEMFGVGRGAATGVEERRGHFALADGGTLFLDEIGELAPPLQAKLLRALQEREIQPVGDRPRSVDARVVAATNADLTRRMEEGAFRPDLFYRLAGHRLEVPPLRRCREDVAGLVEHFLRRAARQVGVRVRGVTARALRLLVDYPWPGNVRELESEMHRLACACIDGQIVDSRLLAEPFRRPLVSAAAADEPREPADLTLAPHLRALEEQLIREALRRAGGSQSEAARLLGLSRNGLANKLRRLRI